MCETAMNFTNRISQTLHEEHRATVARVERLEALMARYRREPPDSGTGGLAQLLADLSSGMEVEVQRHFDFEETRLFRYFDAIGDREIAAHLADEHATMRPIAMEIAKLAREAAAQGFDQAQWTEFRRLGQEFCERILAHVQKEEMALLPLLEENMDADAEARLYEEYVGSA
jgi:hemerythrin-like domain-containing protein